MTQPTAEQRYIELHTEANALVDEIHEHLFDMPAPGTDYKIDWGHVGDLGRLVELLREAKRSFPGR